LPLLEYACELWDECTQQEYNKIEQIQHEAAKNYNWITKIFEFGIALFAYLIFFFFDESEVVPIQFRNKAIPNSKILVIQL
jgi:hypothetical protein